jgi:hypothetical protein
VRNGPAGEYPSVKSAASEVSMKPIKHYRKPGDPIPEFPLEVVRSAATRRWETGVNFLAFALLSYLVPSSFAEIYMVQFHYLAEGVDYFGLFLSLLKPLFYSVLLWSASTNLLAEVRTVMKNRQSKI